MRQPLVAGDKHRYRAACKTKHIHLVVADMTAAICVNLYYRAACKTKHIHLVVADMTAAICVNL